MGKRPDYATTVYGNLIRRKYKDVPVIIGGIEASLRRLAHYDYWSDSLKHSILLDSQADLISYGMGERSIVEIADALNSGLAVKDITFIPGTVYKTRDSSGITGFTDKNLNALLLPGYDEMKKIPPGMLKVLLSSTRIQTPLPPGLWQKVTAGAFSWCRIRPRSLYPRRRWTKFTDCPICAHTTHPMKRQAVFRQWRKSNSP